MRNYELMLGRIASWLVPGGSLFVHLFCHRRYCYFFEVDGGADWMARHFFTGGMMPSVDLLPRCAGPLLLERRWEVGGCDYERTLRAWLANLDVRRAEAEQVLGAGAGAGHGAPASRAVAAVPSRLRGAVRVSRGPRVVRGPLPPTSQQDQLLGGVFLRGTIHMTGSAIAGLGTLLALMTAVWAASAARRDVSIVDVCWSLAVLAAAGVYASGADDMTLRRSVMLVAVFLWAIRLAGYLAWRGWGAAEDKRYRAKRARRPRFRWTSLFVVFWLQAVLAWIVALPLLAVMHVEEPGGPGLLDALGALLFLVGFGFEAAGDWQMARFKADPVNRGRVCDRGL